MKKSERDKLRDLAKISFAFYGKELIPAYEESPAKTTRPTDYFMSGTLIELLDSYERLVEALEEVPKAPMFEFEKDARNWQLCDPDNRHAQHFWEGGLQMRNVILERARQALAEVEG